MMNFHFEFCILLIKKIPFLDRHRSVSKTTTFWRDSILWENVERKKLGCFDGKDLRTQNSNSMLILTSRMTKLIVWFYITILDF